jgi:hypothetical protein
MIVPDRPFPLPRLTMPLFAAVAGAAALGAVALYRRVTRKTAIAAVSRPNAAPRATVVVVESDGPVREPLRAEVPW